MPCNSNNFQHIEKILFTSVHNLVLQITLKFQVYRIIIVRVLLLAELRKYSLKKNVSKSLKRVYYYIPSQK